MIPIYSWHDWSLTDSGVTPMAWCRAVNDPTSEADAVIARAALEGACPPLFIWRPEDAGFLECSLSDFVRGNFNHAALAAWVTTLMGRIAGAGLEPPMLILDYEGGFSRWHAPVTAVTFDQMLADGLEPRLPPYAQGITSDDLFVQPWDREAILQWNRFAVSHRNDAIRQAVVGPTRAAFTGEFPISNYGDQRLSAPVYDLNNWQERYDLSVAGWSSPSCYLSGGGNRYTNLSSAQQADARRLDAIARLRSAYATSPTLAPWISYPGYDNAEARKAWPRLVQDIHPYCRTFLWWNPTQVVASGDYQHQRRVAVWTFARLAEAA